MCSYITEQALISGSAKGPNGWTAVDLANVYFDHPFHAPFDHTLNIDFIKGSGRPSDRVAVELSADSARALAATILAALEAGELAHTPG